MKRKRIQNKIKRYMKGKKKKKNKTKKENKN